MLNTFQQADHPALPKASADEAARQEFTKSFKGFIQSTLLPGLTPVYQTRAARTFEKAHGRPPEDRRDIRASMVGDIYFQHYAAANRIAQELLWESVNGSVDRQLPELIAKARELSAATNAQLVIPEGFVPPRYVTALDIHCMPSGPTPGKVTSTSVAGWMKYHDAVTAAHSADATT